MIATDTLSIYIPLWFDYHSGLLSALLFPFVIYIPLWFDYHLDNTALERYGDIIYIPLWFDYHFLLRSLRDCRKYYLHSTLVWLSLCVLRLLASGL